MRYNDRSVVTAQNIRARLGFKDAHSVHHVAKRFGIEHWKLTGKTLAEFKMSNGIVSQCKVLTVFPAEAFNELLGNKEEKAMIKPITMDVRDNSVHDTPINHIFDGHSVDIIGIDNEPYFGLSSVAAVLGVGDYHKSIDTKDGDYVVKLTNKEISKRGNTPFRKLHNTGELFLTEAGMYKFVLCSRKPNAEKFQKWVTKEVLPSIRKTGGYGAGTLSEVIDNQRIMMRSMQSLWLYLSTRDGLAAGFSREIANKELR